MSGDESSVDRVLAAIDAGLQAPDTTDELDSTWGYGTDRAPTQCARCQRHEPAEGGDLCDGCRQFLLDDTDEDPAGSPTSPLPPGTAYALNPEYMSALTQRAGDALQQFAGAMRSFSASLTATSKAFGIPLGARLTRRQRRLRQVQRRKYLARQRR